MITYYSKMNTPILNTIHSFWLSFDKWAENKNMVWRIVLMAILFLVSFQMIIRENHWCIFSGINLGIHEVGHLMFRFFGEFLYFLGGTILQCAAPVISLTVLMRIPDFFGIPFCGVWLASNFYNVGVYVADARDMALPLVSVGGGDACHDWNYLLSQAGLLHFDRFFGGIFSVAAFFCSCFSLSLGCYMVFRMKHPYRQPKAYIDRLY